MGEAVSWKRLTGGREIDPDFYVEEGPDAVYEDIALARRVYGWEGRMFPRVTVAAYPGRTREYAECIMRVNRFDEPSFTLTCDYKSAQGQWWQKLEGVPLSMTDAALEIISEAKMKLSAKGDGH